MTRPITKSQKVEDWELTGVIEKFKVDIPDILPAGLTMAESPRDELVEKIEKRRNAIIEDKASKGLLDGMDAAGIAEELIKDIDNDEAEEEDDDLPAPRKEAPKKKFFWTEDPSEFKQQFFDNLVPRATFDQYQDAKAEQLRYLSMQICVKPVAKMQKSCFLRF